MGTPHVGYQAAIRLYHPAQEGNLPGVVGAGLYHRHFMLGAQTQKSAWHTDVVVEVALSEEGVVFHCQHGREQFLGGGLAVGARYLHHRDVGLPAMMCRQCLKRGQYILHQTETVVAFGDNIRFVHHGHGTPLLQGLHGIQVAVEILTLQCKKHAPFGAVATVRRNLGMLQKHLV